MEVVNGMNETLLSYIKEITAEEKAILDGRTSIDRDLYMQGTGNIINSRKLLAAGKLITVRPHTRFIHFPEHTHDYVELIYMCAGHSTHIVGGDRIELKKGDLLFLNQSATHEVCKTEQEDIAVNFIILPDFFSTPLAMIDEEETPLRKFLVDCLCAEHSGSGYLHFDVSEVFAIQNLVENLLWILLRDTPNKRKMSQMTMGLLLMQLLGHTESLNTGRTEDAVVWQVLRYIEENYRSGSFSELVEYLHYDPSWLSREIKRKTGKTYTQLLQEKRLAQAAFLLKNTDRNFAEIAVSVGYENVSYFHRIFSSAYGKSPRHYRVGT